MVVEMHRNGKVKDLEELARILGPLRAEKRIVLCHGVFDLLHIGHLRHFEQARALGDLLVVTVTPDCYLNKGPYRSEEGFCEVPALASRVLDRMGAGDAFLSVTVPFVAQEAPLEVVGFIGNAAGAQAVATIGHRQTTGRVTLQRHIECLLK